jgi:hypothetical protein
MAEATAAAAGQAGAPAGSSGAMLTAAELRLAALLDEPLHTRQCAYALLTVDALVTAALEHAAAGDVAAVADEAMRRMSATLP